MTFTMLGESGRRALPTQRVRIRSLSGTGNEQPQCSNSQVLIILLLVK